ncbi:MAG: ADP-ribosyltransferase [Candidatus Margulisbacteria bacterium]|nr:ADP-ribosyltransferase [Candidatus Margulisiibacteriota bacterium]
MYLGKNSYHAGEKELLLNRGQKYKVLEKRLIKQNEKGYNYMVLEAVNE